jgi:hypothetical protein
MMASVLIKDWLATRSETRSEVVTPTLHMHMLCWLLASSCGSPASSEREHATAMAGLVSGINQN